MDKTRTVGLLVTAFVIVSLIVGVIALRIYEHEKTPPGIGWASVPLAMLALTCVVGVVSRRSTKKKSCS